MKTRRKLLTGLSASVLFPLPGFFGRLKAPDGKGDVADYAKPYTAHTQAKILDIPLVLESKELDLIYSQYRPSDIRKLTPEQIALVLSNCNTKVVVS